jgi:metal-responsive CopG/Arc/MetJ family transcriptional regulator
MREHTHAMPNQPAKDKFHTSISVPDWLMAEIDAMAKQEERSRNQVIVRLLRQQMDLVHGTDTNHNTIPDTKSA